MPGVHVIKGKFNELWKRGAFHIFIGSFLSKFVSFFGSIFLVRALSKTSYGQLGYIENIYGYVYIFAGFGLSNALLRYVILGKNIEEKFGYYRYTMIKGTIINIIIVILAGIGLIFYPHPEEFKSSFFLLVLLLMVLPFQYLIDSNSLIFRALFANKKFAIATLATTAILIIGRYIGATINELNGVILATIVVNVVFGVGLCWITYRLYFKGKQPILIQKNEKNN